MTDSHEPPQRPVGPDGLPPGEPFGAGKDDAETQRVPRVPGDEQPTSVLPPTRPAPPPFSSDTLDTSGGAAADSQRRRRRLVVGLVALAVLLVVAGVLGWRFLQSRQFQQELAAERTAARATVETYYAALAAGDAEGALATAAATPAESSLLTAEVLTSAQAAGGIRDVRVGEATIDNDAGQRTIGQTGSVAVAYAVGETPVDIDLQVSRVGDQWKVATATSQVDLGGGEALRSVNGQPAAAAVVELFPGTYTVAPASALVALAEPQLVVAAPDPAGAEMRTWAGGQPALSDEGRQAVLAAAQTSLEGCLAQRSLTPEGCPIAVDAGPDIQVQTSTIRYTLVGSPWEAARLNLESDTRVSGILDLSYRIQASATSGGVAGVVAQDIQQTAGFVADLSGEQPQIAWQ